MTQSHLDRLTAVDAGFLHNEGSGSHMHIGGVALFEGPPPTHEEFIEHLEGRLHLVPRYRQKLVVPPFQTGRPLWADDPKFNIEYHVRHTALPAPGRMDQLLALASRIASQQLDRTKPLWELWLVEGLERDRFAILSKAHHALVDGVSGVELLTVLFDLTPESREVGEGDPWVPDHEPSRAELLAVGARDVARRGLGLASRALEAARHPRRVIEPAREALEGLGEVAWAILNPAPSSPLNVPIGPHRRFAVVESSLSDFKLIKNSLGGTVNDVVLTVVNGSLGRFLRHRGVRTAGLELRALVPVSVRGGDHSTQALGNQITVMLAPLPVHIDDSVLALHHIRQSMDGLKESKQALGAEVITTMESFAPPTILAQASRLSFSSRMYNLLVTNVPGPQFEIYLLGRRLLNLYPLAFLAPDHALAIAAVSYNGLITFGLLGDFDALADIDVVADGIRDALAELKDRAAGVGTGAAATTPARGRQSGSRASRAGGRTGARRRRGVSGGGSARADRGNGARAAAGADLATLAARPEADR